MSEDKTNYGVPEEIAIDVSVTALNEELRRAGMLPLAVVAPTDCIGQDENARYMLPEQMEQLVRNIQSDGRLESVPLVYVDPDRPGKYRILSGHHRVEAAKAAGLARILVMVADPRSRDEIVSKQLAHNAISGLDDKSILAKLFASIQDVEFRLRTGLSDSLANIQYQGLSLKMAQWETLVLLFLPEEIAQFDAVMDELGKQSALRETAYVRVAAMGDWDAFTKVLRKLKRIENIKNDATAVARLIELAGERLAQLAEERAAQNEEVK